MLGRVSSVLEYWTVGREVDGSSPACAFKQGTLSFFIRGQRSGRPKLILLEWFQTFNLSFTFTCMLIHVTTNIVLARSLICSIHLTQPWSFTLAGLKGDCYSLEWSSSSLTVMHHTSSSLTVIRRKKCIMSHALTANWHGLVYCDSGSSIDYISLPW